MHTDPSQPNKYAAGVGVVGVDIGAAVDNTFEAAEGTAVGSTVEAAVEAAEGSTVGSTVGTAVAHLNNTHESAAIGRTRLAQRDSVESRCMDSDKQYLRQSCDRSS